MIFLKFHYGRENGKWLNVFKFTVTFLWNWKITIIFYEKISAFCWNGIFYSVKPTIRENYSACRGNDENRESFHYDYCIKARLLCFDQTELPYYLLSYCSNLNIFNARFHFSFFILSYTFSSPLSFRFLLILIHDFIN